MPLNSRILKLISIIGCVMLITQCTQATDDQLQAKQQATNSYTLPAATYLALAKKEQGEEQQALLIKAAGRLISDGQWQQGLTILTQTNNLSADLAHEKNLLLEKASLIREKSLAVTSQQLSTPPKKMALLLPLTGPLAGPGGAVRDGFVAANSKNKMAEQVKISFYNTDSANVSALYSQAVADGADYIVGPLSKADVATVAVMDHPVPTLLLNDLNTSPKENAYQFGLSPNNEAKEVANFAHQKGHQRALVIAPTGPWGEEVLTAFSSQWQANGGQVVDTMHYDNKDDLNKLVRTFLRITESEGRQKQLKQLLGQHIESITSRRQDFDMVFLLAYPTKARQIMPMLKYYYAGDIPVYATSSVYAGNNNAMRDRDLEGIIFCDMPWVFSHQMASKNWPEQFNSYNRLYALGMDSYALSTQLKQLLSSPTAEVKTKSGVLYLNQAQQIARIPVWGQFKHGLAQLTNNKSASV